MSYKIMPPQHVNCRVEAFIKYYEANIKPFKYCIELSFYDFYKFADSIEGNNIFLRSTPTEFDYKFFFGCKKKLINIYKKSLTDIENYYLSKKHLNINDIDVIYQIDISNSKKTYLISFYIDSNSFNFTDTELDKYNGDIERMLKVKKLAKNIEGF